MQPAGSQSDTVSITSTLAVAYNRRTSCICGYSRYTHENRKWAGGNFQYFNEAGKSCGVSVIIPGNFYFRIRQGFVFFRIIRINVCSTLGVEPDIHWAVIYDFDFVKVKMGYGNDSSNIGP